MTDKTPTIVDLIRDLRTSVQELKEQDNQTNQKDVEAVKSDITKIKGDLNDLLDKAENASLKERDKLKKAIGKIDPESDKDNLPESSEIAKDFVEKNNLKIQTDTATPMKLESSIEDFFFLSTKLTCTTDLNIIDENFKIPEIATQKNAGGTNISKAEQEILREYLQYMKLKAISDALNNQDTAQSTSENEQTPFAKFISEKNKGDEFLALEDTQVVKDIDKYQEEALRNCYNNKNNPIREIIESDKNNQLLVGRHGTFDKASHTYKLSSTMYIRKSKVAERLLTAGLASTGLPVKFKLYGRDNVVKHKIQEIAKECAKRGIDPKQITIETEKLSLGGGTSQLLSDITQRAIDRYSFTNDKKLACQPIQNGGVAHAFNDKYKDIESKLKDESYESIKSRADVKTYNVSGSTKGDTSNQTDTREYGENNPLREAKITDEKKKELSDKAAKMIAKIDPLTEKLKELKIKENPLMAYHPDQGKSIGLGNKTHQNLATNLIVLEDKVANATTEPEKEGVIKEFKENLAQYNVTDAQIYDLLDQSLELQGIKATYKELASNPPSSSLFKTLNASEDMKRYSQAKKEEKFIEAGFDNRSSKIISFIKDGFAKKDELTEDQQKGMEHLVDKAVYRMTEASSTQNKQSIAGLIKTQGKNLAGQVALHREVVKLEASANTGDKPLEDNEKYQAYNISQNKAVLPDDVRKELTGLNTELTALKNSDPIKTEEIEATTEQITERLKEYGIENKEDALLDSTDYAKVMNKKNEQAEVKVLETPGMMSNKEIRLEAPDMDAALDSLLLYKDLCRKESIPEPADKSEEAKNAFDSQKQKMKEDIASVIRKMPENVHYDKDDLIQQCHKAIDSNKEIGTQLKKILNNPNGSALKDAYKIDYKEDLTKLKVVTKQKYTVSPEAYTALRDTKQITNNAKSSRTAPDTYKEELKKEVAKIAAVLPKDKQEALIKNCNDKIDNYDKKNYFLKEGHKQLKGDELEKAGEKLEKEISKILVRGIKEEFNIPDKIDIDQILPVNDESYNNKVEDNTLEVEDLDKKIKNANDVMKGFETGNMAEVTKACFAEQELSKEQATIIIATTVYEKLGDTATAQTFETTTTVDSSAQAPTATMSEIVNTMVESMNIKFEDGGSKEKFKAELGNKFTNLGISNSTTDINFENVQTDKTNPAPSSNTRTVEIKSLDNFVKAAIKKTADTTPVADKDGSKNALDNTNATIPKPDGLNGR